MREALEMLRVKRKHVDRMLGVAHLVSTWGSCPPGRRHGCVLADTGKYIVSTGYNGRKDPCPYAVACVGMRKNEMWRVCKARHAEENALENLPRVPFRLLVAFVTKKPCAVCEQKLRDAGVARVYWEERTIAGGTLHKGTRLLCTR